MDISKDERELYDRQIRLWGLEGQSRLRNARILVLGLEAVAVEVVKNLCLAGVGSLVLQSSRSVEDVDFSFNFFLDSDALGRNTVEASSLAIQRLNPRVSVTTETRSLQELDLEFIATHDVVIVTQTEDREQLSRINNGTRDSDCAFFCCLLNGWGGLVFVDLGSKPHEYVVERELSEDTASSTEVGKVSATREIIDVKKPDRAAGSNTEKITVRESFVSFDDAMSVSSNFARSLKVRHRAKVSPYLPTFLAQLESQEVTEDLIVRKTEQLGLPKSIVTPEFARTITRSRGVQLSSLASVLGGVLSQEVINFLTLREHPIQNAHIYDGLQGTGPIYFLSK